jgi:pimeloyl-ACP methyl ester carboxylesterase
VGLIGREGRPNLNCLLLPGLDGTGELFAPVLARLPTEIRAEVIAYPRDKTLDLSELAAFVLRRLPAEKFVLVAESFSGLVALTLLPEAAERIRGVVFVGAFAEPPRPLLLRLAPMVGHSSTLLRSMPSFLLRQFCVGADATATSIRELRNTISSVAPAVLVQRLAIVSRRHVFKRPSVEIPCCYLRAKNDRLVPASCAEWFRERFPAFQLEEVEGPHFLLQAKPDQAAAVITRQARRMAA